MKTLSERFWEKVDRSGDCWLWTANKSGTGYGKIGSGPPDHKSLLAHRVSWSIANGEVPDGMFVCHRCDNPSCVNPDHLFLGTAMDNMADMVGKDRHARGERGGNRILTDRQVFEIKDMFIDGVRWDAISRIYGVSRSTIYHIMEGRLWSHLTVPMQ